VKRADADRVIQACRTLSEKFSALNLYRPLHRRRHEEGAVLEYEVNAVDTGSKARIRVNIEAFVGGGFAGQVYRVKVLDIENATGPIGSLSVGGTYALKIMVPPGGFSRFFRNLLFRIGFQGPFQLQVNPVAVRAGALWQKFFRRGALIRFGQPGWVNDIHATLIDHRLGSCGEISDWVDGRTWRLEVDDHLDYLKRYLRKRPVDTRRLGSPEYRSKRRFMNDFVRLLHDMGGREFARQYEWWTAKSQPNCLKRRESDPDPEKGLVAVDFRSGLVLLPFLPMSPADFRLILSGLVRGRLVQFDRGDVGILRRFVAEHSEEFADMKDMLEDLEACEKDYRRSLPDLTHHHVRLLWSRKIWRTVLDSARRGWWVTGTIDESGLERLKRSTAKTLLFYLLSGLPFVGWRWRRLWGHRNHRRHLLGLHRWSYLKKAVLGRRLETLMAWVRRRRVTPARAETLSSSPGRFLAHMPLSLLPAGLHRFFSDRTYAAERLSMLFVRPFRLYFNAQLREEWLREMLVVGQKKQMLSGEDARIIESQLPEPFIQKYLKSLAVHLLTLPVTQIVSVLVSWIYVRLNPHLSTAEAMAAVAAILVLFQITPISPGSLVRGFYVLFLVIRERNFRDYNIAVFLGFFKYIGYLAFPIQMAYRYPALARFMAGHWATEAVHVVPVFGEQGALLEHWVFNLFYNWPLTVRRRMRTRMDARAARQGRIWHIWLVIVAAVGIGAMTEVLLANLTGIRPRLTDTWWLWLGLSVVAGAVHTRLAGGMGMVGRVVNSSICGVLIGLAGTAAWAWFVNGVPVPIGDVLTEGMWRVFLCVVFSTAGTLLWELRWPDPELKAGP